MLIYQKIINMLYPSTNTAIEFSIYSHCIPFRFYKLSPAVWIMGVSTAGVNQSKASLNSTFLFSKIFCFQECDFTFRFSRVDQEQNVTFRCFRVGKGQIQILLNVFGIDRASYIHTCSTKTKIKKQQYGSQNVQKP